MKNIFFILILIIGSCNAATQLKKSDVIEKIKIDLNNDRIIDTIIISSKPDGDPGEFRRIVFKISGAKDQVFDAKDAWDKVAEDFLKINKNQIKSNRVFLQKQDNKVLILLFGYIYGSGRDEFTIISIENNLAKEIFNEAYDFYYEFTDLDRNGNIDLVARNAYETYKDTLQGFIGVYSPFLVYTIKNNNCALNETLTQSYNEKNYVFAGFKYSEAIKVYYPNDNGKHFIIK